MNYSNAILSFAAACLLALGTAHAAEKAPPNILLIVSDDQGYQDIHAAGREDIVTPHLDRLCAEGVRLTNFYVSWPACTPSRGSILTGRYPQRNGLYDMIRNDLVNYGHQYSEEEYAVSPEMTLGMDLREVMISEVLSDAGYACGVFGKWDGGRARRYLPLQQGFDVFYGFANTGIDYWTHERYGIASMFRDNEPTTEDKGTYCTDLFEREALRFIRENRDRPFFCYVPFNAPHGASNLDKPGVQAPPETISRYYGQLDPAAKETSYLACVTRMDEAIGRLLDTLDELGVADNTLVFFCSDNGGAGAADNGPLRGSKSTMFEGGVRVCAVARFPGRIEPGTVSNELLTTLELFPTIARQAGAELPADLVLDGFDMLPVLAGEQSSPRQEMFWQRRGDRAARVGQYKWVQSAKGNGLYDLQADVGEKHDLSQQQPEVLARLKQAFAQWQAKMEAAEPRGPFRNY